MSENKIAVITGGSSGIGEAIANALVKHNFSVVNADIEAPHERGGADHVKCDVTSAADIAHLYDHVKQRYGVPHVLISNAGQGIHEKISEGDPEKWKQIIDLNLIGALRFLRAFLSEMLMRKHGDIIIISSTAGQQPYEYGGIYSASKAALGMVAKTLRLEVAPLLRVFMISPGVVDTPFFKHMISSNHTVEDIGWGSLSAQQVSDIALYLINLPDSVSIPEVTLKPSGQV